MKTSWQSWIRRAGPRVTGLKERKKERKKKQTKRGKSNLIWFNKCWELTTTLRATSHMRLRARHHFTSSTLIGGKGGAGPSSLHTTLEGPMEYVNARWMKCLHGFLHDIEWIMFHGHLDYFQKPPLGGRLNTKPGDLGTLNFEILEGVWEDLSIFKQDLVHSL
jgi:hypothetical protein